MSTLRIFIDCTNIIKNNYDNGVSRVVRNIIYSLYSRRVVNSREIYASQILNDKIYSFNPRFIGNYYFKPLHRRYSNRFIRFFLRFFDQFYRRYSVYKIFGSRKILSNIFKDDYPILILPDATWAFEFNLALDKFKNRGGKVIFYIHDIIPLQPLFSNEHIRDIQFQNWIDWGILNADILLCVSNDSRNLLLNYIKILHPNLVGIEQKIRVLHSGYEITGNSVQSIIRDDIVSVTDKSLDHVFLVIGSADTRKNLNYIYQSFQSLWGNGHKVKLIFGGPFSPKDRFIEDLKNSEYYKQSLFIFSNLSDAELDYLYNKASALVFASKAEGFGLPIVEAMTRGLPIICSDIAIFRELADGYARFVNISDKDGLVHSLIKFLEETPVEKRLSRAPRPWRSWDDYADELLAICREVVGNGSTSDQIKD